MWRLLILFSVLPLVLALVLRWWFGMRVLAGEGRRPCRCDLARWMPAPGDTAVTHRAEETADEFGRQLRLKALAEWRERDPKAAASREASRRFGTAVPPLSAIIAVFGALVGRIPIPGAIAVVLAATALAAGIGLLSLAPELRAIALTARKSRENRSFSRSDDEDAVVSCAIAHAWKQSLPPLLTLLQR